MSAVVEKILLMCSEQSVNLNLKDGAIEVLFDEMPTEELIGLLREHKPDLIDYLSEHEAQSLLTPLKAIGENSGPLSFSQKRLWFIDQLEDGSVHYNMPMALELKGDLNKPALQKALTSVVNRHQVLRTRYEVGGATQVVMSEVDIGLNEVNLSELKGDTDAALERLMIEEQLKPFNLQEDLMLRNQLIKVRDKHHVLLLTLHHIACDGSSLGIVVNELCQLYTAEVNQDRSTLNALPLQYLDYAYWQDTNRDNFEQQLGFWVKHLAQAPTLHSLQTDHPRPTNQSFAGDNISVKLDGVKRRALENLCQQYEVTPFMFCYSVYALLMAKLSNEQDLVIGTPVANRHHTSIKPLIGYFANTLALRSQVNSGQSFNEYLAANKQAILDALQNQSVPFEMVVERLKPTRDLAYSPLFQIMFSFHSHGSSELKLPELNLTDITPKAKAVKADLELAITEQGDGFVLDWNFSTALFERDTIAGFAASFEHLLEAVVANTDQTLDSYSILTSQEQVQLQQWVSKAAPADVPSEKTIIERFEAVVARQPDAVAVVAGEQILSYAELDQKANQVAHYLCEQGSNTNQPVGINMQRSELLIVGLLGILKSGACYLPLEASYPKARLDYMIDDSGVEQVLNEALIEQVLSGTQAITRDGLPSIEPQHLAYIIYTSGSTGNPKGVKVSHENVLTLIDGMSDKLKDGGTWLAVSGIAFDMSILDLFGTLTNGFKVVLYAGEPSQNGAATEDVDALVAKHRVTHMQCTPSFASMHLMQGTALSQLQHLFIGGEAMPTSLVEHLDGFDSLKAHNMYGPTEATVWACSHTLNNEGQSVPIGQPLPGYQIRILDAAFNEQPIGVPGELHIAGKAVTQGYLKRDELTAEKFVDSPFDGAKLYKTGDKARWNRSGRLEFLGRMDSQVKLRGHRIELDEIGSLITLMDEVENAVVILDELPAGARLAAYIKPKQWPVEQARLVDQVKTHLSAVLPEYMVPTAWLAMENLPLTLNGKINRRALPQIDVAAQQESFVAADSDTEKALIALWSDLLVIDADKISCNISFFDLGGHSLLLTKMVAEVKSQFDIELSFRDIFENATVEALAAFLDNHAKSRQQSELLTQATTVDAEQTEEFVL